MSIESLMANNATIREGKRLRIVCKVRGHPPPKVTWFKDNRSIAKNRSRYQFVHLRWAPTIHLNTITFQIGQLLLELNYMQFPITNFCWINVLFVYFRRRSELIIKEAFLNDSGQYECRAKNKLARQPIKKLTRIDVLPKAQEYTSNFFYQFRSVHCCVFVCLLVYR